MSAEYEDLDFCYLSSFTSTVNNSQQSSSMGAAPVLRCLLRLVIILAPRLSLLSNRESVSTTITPWQVSPISLSCCASLFSLLSRRQLLYPTSRLTPWSWVWLVLALSGDVELNPGPRTPKYLVVSVHWQLNKLTQQFAVTIASNGSIIAAVGYLLISMK